MELPCSLSASVPVRVSTKMKYHIVRKDAIYHAPSTGEIIGRIEGMTLCGLQLTPLMPACSIPMVRSFPELEYCEECKKHVA